MKATSNNINNHINNCNQIRNQKSKREIRYTFFFYTPHHFLSFSLLHLLLQYVDKEVVTKEATTEHTIPPRIILTQYLYISQTILLLFYAFSVR